MVGDEIDNKRTIFYIGKYLVNYTSLRESLGKTLFGCIA